ncbi:MAG: PKD domain-containing protein, partial [Bacteroidales bacterium]|nr:PKD domain-containing protein [Bacteroidales bacterium]
EGGTPSSSNNQNPSNIVYNSTGTFSVTLTVSNGTNTNTITKTNYITVSTEYLMQNITVTTCEGAFYDSGGPSGNYSDNEDLTMTFLPAITDNKIKCVFTSFNVEWESTCDYDWLKIYDGTSTSASLIGTYCGTVSPGTIIATNNDGAITFQFHSDYYANESGWIANISCESPSVPPITNFIADITNIYEGESVNFTDLSLGNPTSWEWILEGGTPGSSTEQNPTIVYNTPGIYSVTLTATNQYGSDTKTIDDYITVNELVGIEENVNKNTIKIFPNPAVSDIINIQSGINIKNIIIMDVIGKIIFNEDFNSSLVQIKLNNYQPGIYLIKIKISNRIINRKIFISKL